jgi:hypothetical protein
MPRRDPKRLAGLDDQRAVGGIDGQRSLDHVEHLLVSGMVVEPPGDQFTRRDGVDVAPERLDAERLVDLPLRRRRVRCGLYLVDADLSV